MRKTFYVSEVLPMRKAEGEEAEMGVKWVRKAVFEIPHELANDEFVVTMYDDDALFFLCEGDEVVATLIFQGCIDGNECHQTIIASNLDKLW